MIREAIPGRGRWGLGELFRAYRGRILLTYALFNLENLLHLAQPFALGLAVTGLLGSSWSGLALFAGLHLGHLLIGTWRRAYDTRAFTGIYTDLATRLVIQQRGRDVEVSRVTARSALSRELVDFFERDVPQALYAVYAVFGALAMLALYDLALVPLCLALLVPAAAFNYLYGRKSFALSGRLHDQLEREVEVIGGGRPAQVRDHYARLAGWRVKLSDWQALSFGVLELFVLGLLAAALWRTCTAPGAAAGDVFAVFRYVWMFVTGLDSVPLLVQQAGRLRDIGRRMLPASPARDAA
jgi:hypothetical protein